MCLIPDKSTKLQCMPKHSGVYSQGEKKTTYLKIKGAQKYKVGWVGTECGSERRWGRGEKYDQKTLYEILKCFLKPQRH